MSKPVFDLTDLKSTNDAERLGPFLTRDQYLFLAGARDATARWYSATTVEHRHCKDPVKKAWLLQLCQDYAWQGGVIRECLDLAPVIAIPVFAAGHGVQGEPATPSDESGHETARGDSLFPEAAR